MHVTKFTASYSQFCNYVDMLSEATQQVMEFVERAKQKSRSYESYVSQLEQKKEQDERKLHRDEARVFSGLQNKHMNAAHAIIDVFQDANTIMDDKRQLADMRRKVADAKQKIAEIKHWMGQTEFKDNVKRVEAVNVAAEESQAV